METEPDNFGLYKSYRRHPTHDPDAEIGLRDLCDGSTLDSNTIPRDPNIIAAGLPPKQTGILSWGPFKQASTYLLMHWSMCGSNMKSAAELNKLVHDVLLNENFDLADLKGFNAIREGQCVDDWDGGGLNLTTDGWIESTVKIKLPCDGIKCAEDEAPEIEIPGVFHRDLVDVIVSAYQGPGAKRFHLTPFTQLWKPSEEAEPVRVYGEAYTSDAMLEMQIEVEQLHAKNLAELAASDPTAPPKPKLEVVVAPVMVWSDATSLASYGTASIWPGYAFLGALSKYIRALPTSNSANHFVYIPSVSLISTVGYMYCIDVDSITSCQTGSRTSTSAYSGHLPPQIRLRSASANYFMLSGI